MKQEPEKQQRRGRSDWPGTEKDTGHAEEQVARVMGSIVGYDMAV